MESKWLLISRVSEAEHYKIYAEYTLNSRDSREYHETVKKNFTDTIDKILGFDEGLVRNALVIDDNQTERYYIDTFSAYRVYRHDWDSEKNCFLCDDNNRRG